MVNLRRFGPLLVALALGLGVLISRLYDVQVAQHRTWAREAANLVRSWSVEPYRRGAILDREGRVLVEDENVYEVDFIWRDFRRGHPLGQVSQLLSVLSMQHVSIEEIRPELLPWALAFASLSPGQVDRFGRGEGLSVREVCVPAVSAKGRRGRALALRLDGRRPRASELHFYIKALFGLERTQQRALERLRRKRVEASYLSLAAEVAGLQRAEMAERLRDRLASSIRELESLAKLVDWHGLTEGLRDFGPGWDGGSSLPGLVRLIEGKRGEVQFSIADALFRAAWGFDPSRLSEPNLTGLDLEWLRTAMNWGPRRLAEWCGDRGSAWQRAVSAYVSGYTIVRSKLSADRIAAADRVLSSFAAAFDAHHRRSSSQATPRPWWEVREIVGLFEILQRCEDSRALAGEFDSRALPFQQAPLSELDARERREMLDLEKLSLALDEDVDSGAREQLLSVAQSSSPTWNPGDKAPFEAVLLAWDAALQARVAELLNLIPAGVRLEKEWIDAALKQRAYVVRDRGARPVLFDPRPEYDLVHLITRDPEGFAGFRVRATSRRVHTEFAHGDGEDRVPLAAELIGRVRSPYLLDIFQQRQQQSDLRELRRQLKLGEQDFEMIGSLLQTTVQAGEVMGGGGIEGYFDGLLKGTNGYKVSTGLQDRQSGISSGIHQPATSGQNLWLTLDRDLQRAAQELIDNPGPPPPGVSRPDRVWHQHPVGAIVLISVEGQVLAAASGPSRSGGPVGPHQDGQGAFAHERTLRQHTHQPPGSVLKPFVVAWALEQGCIQPGTSVSCLPAIGETHGVHRPGGTVRCHKLWGHGFVDLERALLQSCNPYFAMLGETCYDAQGFREMARAFGFDRPTGVRHLDLAPGPPNPLSGTGLREDGRSPGFFVEEWPATRPTLQRLGNGLTAISVTPLQLARAYVGLATGRLPELRLVRRVGERPVELRSSPLPISTGHLETVRAALRQVPLRGTARGSGLDPESLGFSFACKTGSADYRQGQVPASALDVTAQGAGPWKQGMRKHAWVAGWFPARDPVAVAVVYVHDTSTTSGNIATHVMASFLRSEAVRAWERQER